MVDVRGDVLRPPHGTTPAAVKSNIKSEMRSFKSNESCLTYGYLYDENLSRQLYKLWRRDKVFIYEHHIKSQTSERPCKMHNHFHLYEPRINLGRGLHAPFSDYLEITTAVVLPYGGRWDYWVQTSECGTPLDSCKPGLTIESFIGVFCQSSWLS